DAAENWKYRYVKYPTVSLLIGQYGFHFAGGYNFSIALGFGGYQSYAHNIVENIYSGFQFISNGRKFKNVCFFYGANVTCGSFLLFQKKLVASVERNRLSHMLNQAGGGKFIVLGENIFFGNRQTRNNFFFFKMKQFVHHHKRRFLRNQFSYEALVRYFFGKRVH